MIRCTDSADWKHSVYVHFRTVVEGDVFHCLDCGHRWGAYFPRVEGYAPPPEGLAGCNSRSVVSETPSQAIRVPSLAEIDQAAEKMWSELKPLLGDLSEVPWSQIFERPRYCGVKLLLRRAARKMLV